MKSGRDFLLAFGATEKQVRAFDARRQLTVPKNDIGSAEHLLWVSIGTLALVQPSGKLGELDFEAGSFVLRHLPKDGAALLEAYEPLGTRITVTVRDVRFKAQREVDGGTTQTCWDYHSDLAHEIIQETRANAPDNPRTSYYGPEWLMQASAGQIMRWFVPGSHTRVDSMALLENESSIIQSQKFPDPKHPHFRATVLREPQRT